MITPPVIETAIASLFSSVPRSAACDDLHHCRSIPSIVFGCTSTIFLCTWVVLHPDVPKNPREALWKRLSRRIGLMMLALLGPEAIFAWALKQWVNACQDLERRFGMDPNCTWTETHAMLAEMDGIELVSEGGSAAREKALVSLPVDVSMLSEAEIKDKSKADSIAKGITIIQTLWFAVQAAHRVSQGLDVTELELTTLGHVVLSIIIYWFWWNKPMNVQFPVEVREANDKEEESSRATQLSFRVRMGAYIKDSIGGEWFSTWKDVVFLCTLWFVGGLFGMVHCLAWNSTFPTQMEQRTWRICALIVTFLPGLCMTIGAASDRFRDGALNDLLVFVLLLLGAVYALARISLLIIALKALHDLPYSALEIPSWTFYIPHIA